MKAIYKYNILFLCVSILFSCAKENKLTVDVSDIGVNLKVDRFDTAFYNTPVDQLGHLKKMYPRLFPTNTPDSIWVAKMQDKDEQELFSETQKLYENFDEQNDRLISLFKHVKYYYEGFEEPTVVTLLTNVNYESKVISRDSLLLISLDVFLGADSPIYDDFPEYIKRNFTNDHIVVAAAAELAKREIPRTNDRTFIARIIQRGKLLYMLDAFLPEENDALKIGYTEAQIHWADFNDVDVWKYFIENDYLFSTDQELSRRFIEEAPFSKFFLANDNESPGKIGAWFGWQIVRAYMQNNEVSLQEMLRTDNAVIFKKSKYKPTK